MPTTRSRVNSQGRRDDATNDAFPEPPRPTSPIAPTPPVSSEVGDRAGAYGDAPASPRAEMTFSNDNVASIIASLQRSQTEALREILESVTRANTSTPVSSFVPPGQGTLTRCKATFSGRPQESVEAFIDAVEAYSECAQVTDSNILRGLAYLFTEEAATWWQGIKSTISSWSQAKDNLISAYGDRRPTHRIYLDIFSTPQQNENTDMYVARTRALLSKIPQGDITEKVRLDMTYGLLHNRIKKRLRREDFETFADLLRLARNVEDSLDTRTASAGGRRAPVPTTAQRAPLPSGPGGAVRTAPPPSTGDARGPSPWSTVATRATPPSATATPPSMDSGADKGMKKQRPLCSYCKRYGHNRDQCRKLANQGESRIPNNSPAEMRDSGDRYKESFYSVELSGSRVKCVNNNHGESSNSHLNVKDIAYHNKNCNCLHKTNNACKQNIDLERRPNSAKCRCLNFVPDIACNIQNYDCVCFRNWVPHKTVCVSTSSEKNFNSDNVCNVDSKHFCSRKVDNSPRASSTEKLPHDFRSGEHLQKSTQCFCLSKHLENYRDDGHVTEGDNCTFQKSGDLLPDDNCVNNIVNNCISNDCICSGDVILPGNSRERPGTCRELRPIFKIDILGVSGTALIDTAAKHCIAGHTLYALLLRKGHLLVPSTRQIKLADGHVRDMEVLTTSLAVSLEQTVITIPFLIFPDANNNETLLGIDFITAAGVVIDFHKETWCFSNSNTQHKLLFEPASRGISCSSVHVLRDDEGAHLNPAERNALAEVLVRHAHIFEAGGGPTPYAEHCIETGNHPPIAVPPYRLNPAKKELMKKEIDKMIDDDVIEECESAWCSPALMVPKPDGSIRFCVDYRRLNAITKSDAYPMPRIDELLQSTKRNCYMSSLDLRSSYWQVRVRESDKDKTAFISPLGTYRFKKMPFGLKNAPATFQRLIDRLRSCAALKEVTILAYLDDLLVISEGFQQHLKDLELVMKRLEEFNLHVNRKKCAFARESVRYLGHVITQEGISTDPQKVSAVLEMKEPANIKHLRTFLQTCSWFRKFIPNFSKVAEPLTRLTRKSQVWIWGSEQSHAFNDLKQLLTSAPILVQPDFNSPFVLRTDASNYALGAVLLQGEGKQERPIEYASRLLNDAERNYSTTEREALAVVWGVERFRSYLDGHPVIIGSDHQPLRWLLSLKSPTGRLVRWALKLQSFDIKFEYTPGKANVLADTLSRPICSNETRDSCGICSIICDLPTKSPDNLRQEQLSDPEVAKIAKELEGTDEVAARRWTERGYLMNQGVLYRYNPDSESESPQLVIPADQVVSILKELHDDSLAGHPGIDRTYHKVAQLYYFTGMRRIISDYVKACIHCQRYKATNAKPPGLLQTPIMNQRNEVLAIDLFGPLPEGDQGERWILLVEDTATRWIELFALKDATAEACARVLIEGYFMRFGLPRRIISDNGVQFVSAVMRQCMSVLGIKQNFVPLYHPEANPAERKNRDLKAMLAQLVEEDHTSWPKKLPVIRFALNGAKCRTTGMSPAYLTFGREMRSPTEVTHDLRSILDKDNFVPQITPYLRKFVNSLSEIRERVEIQQDKTKEYADQSRRSAETFQVGNLVLLKSHVLSNAAKNVTAKFAPKRDGPYQITAKISPTTYTLSHVDQPCEVLGKYHIQDLSAYKSRGDTTLPRPVIPKRKRGRPGDARVLVQERGRSPELEGEHIVNHSAVLPIRSSRGRLPARFLE